MVNPTIPPLLTWRGRFRLAVLAPGGPELEQYHLTLNRRVVELIPGSSLGTEARSRLAGSIGEHPRSVSHRAHEGY
jgi:hypothetical protein